MKIQHMNTGIEILYHDDELKKKDQEDLVLEEVRLEQIDQKE